MQRGRMCCCCNILWNSIDIIKCETLWKNQLLVVKEIQLCKSDRSIKTLVPRVVQPGQHKFKKPPTVTLIIWRAFLLHLLCVYSCSKMLCALPDDIKQADFTLQYCLTIRLKLKWIISPFWLENAPHLLQFAILSIWKGGVIFFLF